MTITIDAFSPFWFVTGVITPFAVLFVYMFASALATLNKPKTGKPS